MCKRFARKIEAELARRAAAAIELREHRAVIGRRYDDEHVLEILRRRAHQARAADVDLFDQGLERRVGIRRGFHKRIQVDDDEIDQGDPVRRRRRDVVGPAAPREDAAVHQRMQRLHAAVHHLGKAGDFGDPNDGQSRLLKGPCGAAGRNEVETARGEAARKVDEAGFVRNADEGSGHESVRGQLSGLRGQVSGSVQVSGCRNQGVPGPSY